ncbi:MAG: hypothetical protein COB60_05675 [Flavobacteriaceae bacterium]|nr:MAG: hypothetical protein COB60_05675 [Flavobacteriaceae bacterium]
MKTVFKIIGIVTVAIVMESCSSVKVTDSWKDIRTPEIKNKNILVVSKTGNETARVRFEKDMVDVLNDNGYKSVESFVKFPEIEQTNEIDYDRWDKLTDKLKHEGIEVVIMTVLRDTKQFTKTTTSSSVYSINTYPFYYGRGYYRGYYRHYGTMYSESYPITSVTTEGKIYVLETIVYDLTQPKDKRVLSVLTTRIDNPDTLGTTSEDFSKKIVKALKK